MARIFTRALKYGIVGTVAAVGGSEVYSAASGHAVMPAWLKYTFNGYSTTFDYQSVRRGYFVYKQVCAACHQIEYLKYMMLVGCALSEDEAKEHAAESEIQHD